MSRDTVRLLYKTKLSLCRRMGYQYGNWNSKNIFDNNKIGKRQIEKLTKQGLLGHYIWNTIRTNCKHFTNVDNIILKEELISHGFANLRSNGSAMFDFDNRPIKLLPYK